VEEDDLEPRNLPFWQALLERVGEDRTGRIPRIVLDVGAHRGGLLAKIVERWRPTEVWAVEPVAGLRDRARLRLRTLAPRVEILGTEQWSQVGTGTVDLLTCHEVLHVVEDLPELFRHWRRVLAPDGVAYVALGCHTDNPVWSRWRPLLEDQGIRCFDHAPLGIMAEAARVGFQTAVRPLLAPGWVRFDPLLASFPFATVSELLDHHHKHKLLFRLVPT
jgi:SAM-dependent methyltransferase